jgi:hypothetical protein
MAPSASVGMLGLLRSSHPDQRTPTSAARPQSLLKWGRFFLIERWLVAFWSK